jgi:branched-chain amino acid transport system ATP-binding protein
MAIVIVEHNIPLLASLCSHLVVMLTGKNLTEGSPSTVLSDKRVIEAYLGRSAAKRGSKP